MTLEQARKALLAVADSDFPENVIVTVARFAVTFASAFRRAAEGKEEGNCVFVVSVGAEAAGEVAVETAGAVSDMGAFAFVDRAVGVVEHSTMQ
jgi:hypothetical protein